MLHSVEILFAVKEPVVPGKTKASKTKEEAAADAGEDAAGLVKQKSKRQKAAAPKTTVSKTLVAPAAVLSPPRVREVHARPSALSQGVAPRPSSGPQRAAPSVVTRRPVAANSLCAAQRRSADAQNVWNFDMRPPDREALIAEQDAMLARLKHAKDGPRGPTFSPPHARPKSSSGLSRRPLIGNNGNVVKPLAVPTPHVSSEPQKRWNSGVTPFYREEQERRAVPSQATARLAVPLPRGRRSLGAERGRGQLVEVVNAAALLGPTADD